MLRKARAAFSGWSKVMPHLDFTLMNRSLATAEQLIVLYFDPISLFPLQVYYIVAALADLSGKPLSSSSHVVVRRFGPGTVSDSAYRFPVSELQSSLANPGISQGRRVKEADSEVLGVLTDCCRWLSNSDLGAFHLSDLSLDLIFSAHFIHDSIQARRLWVCLELISEHSEQVSSIRRIRRSSPSPVKLKLGNMTILAEADHRCRLRVLLSTSRWKPSKPGMILGEWSFNLRSLTEHADSKNSLKLCMYDQSESPSTTAGSLRFAISPMPAFSPSKRRQIPAQFLEPHTSNKSPGIFSSPQTKKSGGDSGGVSQGPDSQRGLPSVLDLNLTFKEPDEYRGPELVVRQITAAFRDLKGGLLFVFARVRHPKRYMRYILNRRHSNQMMYEMMGPTD
ncbi:hypothetical protein F4604DRAFT_1913731 [Suillus subluteus]|nr:hypothetical protein F4604DRAFT_1913731 [Suillus subluteus]